MKIPIAVAAAALVLAFRPAVAAPPEKTLTLVPYGSIQIIQEGGDIKVHKEYRMAWGDTRVQDQIANAPGRSDIGPFAMNAANYYHAADGGWNLFNFKLPSESLTDPAAMEERGRFREYLSRPGVDDAVRDHLEKTNFGRPGDFIYKRMGLASRDLPAPFNRLSQETLAAIAHILQYNADGTMKIYFRQPLDQEDPAQELFQRIAAELGQTKE